MQKKILECVPNFSEGRDMDVIRQITDVIESVDGIKLLDVDPGKDTNRTVVTFVGEPENVCEAAFRAVRKASELIDMSKHHGEHPRMGATDVLPLIPVSGISMEETADLARKLGKRIGEELDIPVYCYENAASEEKRKNLANCRAGEYEGLPEKLSDPEWKPDFGPARFNSRSGATAVGARDFLVAFNVNLNTTSTRRANAVAFDVREKGREITGADGKKITVPGSLRSVKAIGWFIEEYGFAQISMNLTNISVTPVHVAFDEVCRKAEARGLRVTGSELVGLIPLKAMLDAGRYFLSKQQRSAGVPDSELIKIAVRSMGMSEVHEFRPEEKIIEYVMTDSKKTLADQTLQQFMESVASESPAPGGGSVAAYIGSLGAALGTMVGNLSSHKKGWDERWEEFSRWAEKGKEIQNRLLSLVEEDTAAFNKVMSAFALPKKTEEEKISRRREIEEATRNAAGIPLMVMKEALTGFEVARFMAAEGNPASVSDAGVGAISLRACIRGAWLNVRINLSALDDKVFSRNLGEEAEAIVRKAEAEETYILKIVEDKINS